MAVKPPATAGADHAGVPHSHARFADPMEVAPGAVVVPSFHGDDAAPFLVPVNVLVLCHPPTVVLLGGMPLPATERLWPHVDPAEVAAVVATRANAGVLDDVRALLAVCRGATAYGPAALAGALGPARAVPVGPGDDIGGLRVTAAGAGGCDLGLSAPGLGLWWSSSRLATPVRHPVLDAADLDDGYWRDQLDLWDPADLDAARAVRPSVVVPGHGVVLRGRRLREALAERPPPCDHTEERAELARAIGALACCRH